MPVASTWSDTTFASMGSTARLLVLGGPPDLPARARQRLVDLESRWSRFIPTSELCRLNAAAGAPVVVSADTFAVIDLGLTAWRATGGRFDPTVLAALERAGYDRDFDQIPASAPDAALAFAGEPRGASDDASRDATPGCAGVELDRLVSSVRLPPGVRLDLGGIGKGHAADVLTGELLDRGAEGVCVNLGGDVRVAGAAPEPEGWRIDLDPQLTPAGEPCSFRLGAGAVATSTRLKRAWTRDGSTRHHIIDPATGSSAWSGLATVTVLADRAAWAEMLAKAALIAGPVVGAALLRAQGVTGRFGHDDGRTEDLPGLDAFRR